jgi:hypothetical protein
LRHGYPLSVWGRGPIEASANETARALRSMMAGSTTRSNQRPDTLMQDRTSARSTLLMARASRPVGPRRIHCFVVHPVTLVEVAARLIKSQQLKHSHLHSDRHFKTSTSSELRLRAQTVAPEPRHASRGAAGPCGTERNQSYWPPNFVSRERPQSVPKALQREKQAHEPQVARTRPTKRHRVISAC